MVGERGRKLSLDELRKGLTDEYRVVLEFTGQLHGGVPKSPDVIDAWIKSRVNDEHRVDALAAEAKADMGVALTDAEVEEVSKAAWNGFRADELGLFLMGYQVKALLKEAANVLKGPLDANALKSRVAERMFVVEDHIPITRDGVRITAPDGFVEKYIHAMVATGPINALNKTDYIEAGCRVGFVVRLLKEMYLTKTKKDRIAPEDLLRILLEYGQDLGLGANRSQGYGRYRIVEFEKV